MRLLIEVEVAEGTPSGRNYRVFEGHDIVPIIGIKRGTLKAVIDADREVGKVPGRTP